ncbi:hypothetical protein KQX54_019338 [Cotesia glomerata]|uniref:Uncharacterized protein n=2 Tax=Cotesia glomerata TaxID=32391 RepID=A0AAV7IBG0_COTGL|nr:hypothetical protein KQX54_019338 [Cotesia glomerata]
MADDLLIKEKEFRRINKELESKTHKLLEEIDTVINNNHKNNFETEIVKFRTQSAFNFFNSEYKSAENQEIKNDRRDDFDYEEEIFSLKSENKKNQDVIIKFLKAKIKLLTGEVDILKDDLKKKCDLIRDLENNNKKISECKEKLVTQINNLKDNIGKLENNISTQQNDIQAHLNENNSLKKEIQKLNKEIKSTTQQINILDLRLNRSLEDNEKLKNSLKSSKNEERNNVNKIRKLEDHIKVITKNNERLRQELVQAFRKQSLLVDNLKKQKAYLETTRQVELTRDDFLKIIKAYV